MPGPAGIKRIKELKRQDKQKEKAERKEARRRERASDQPTDEGEDPDIAHIVPGPQPPPDWMNEE